MFAQFPAFDSTRTFEAAAAVDAAVGGGTAGLVERQADVEEQGKYREAELEKEQPLQDYQKPPLEQFGREKYHRPFDQHQLQPPLLDAAAAAVAVSVLADPWLTVGVSVSLVSITPSSKC